MSEKQVVETIKGPFHKYEIVRESPGLFGLNPKFYVRRDGKAWKGSFSSLDAAVRAAKEG